MQVVTLSKRSEVWQFLPIGESVQVGKITIERWGSASETSCFSSGPQMNEHLCARG